MRYGFVSAVAGLAAIAAGCGSSYNSSSPSNSGKRAAASPAAAKPVAQPVAVTTKEAKKLGTIMAAGNKRLSVYLFEADKGTKSSCSGACARVWPPVTGKPHAIDGGLASHLGTTARADGSAQVTYRGHPLYFYVKDKDDGDTYGQGIKSFGADWYVLAPSGKKVDKS